MPPSTNCTCRASPTATATESGTCPVSAPAALSRRARRRRDLVSPWYPSPRSDAGYDVADYRSIDPAFGTLADADALIAEGHALGIRTIIYPAPITARTGTGGSGLRSRRGRAHLNANGSGPARARPAGDLPPNDWPSIFGGPAWTRTTAPDGTRGSGTCTCLRPSSRTSTGSPRGAAGVRGHPALRSIAASTAFGSIPPRCWPRTRRCPSPRARHPIPTATMCMISTGPAEIAD